MYRRYVQTCMRRYSQRTHIRIHFYTTCSKLNWFEQSAPDYFYSSIPSIAQTKDHHLVNYSSDASINKSGHTFTIQLILAPISLFLSVCENVHIHQFTLLEYQYSSHTTSTALRVMDSRAEGVRYKWCHLTPDSWYLTRIFGSRFVIFTVLPRKKIFQLP